MFIFRLHCISSEPSSLSWTNYVYLRRELVCCRSWRFHAYVSTLWIADSHSMFVTFGPSLMIDLKLDFCMVRCTRPSRLPLGLLRPIGSRPKISPVSVAGVHGGPGPSLRVLIQIFHQPFWQAPARDQSRQRLHGFRPSMPSQTPTRRVMRSKYDLWLYIYLLKTTWLFPQGHMECDWLHTDVHQ